MIVSLSITSCGSGDKTVVYSRYKNAERTHVRFDPKREYEIVIANEVEPVRSKGKYIERNVDVWLIKDKKGFVKRAIEVDKVIAIHLVD